MQISVCLGNHIRQLDAQPSQWRSPLWLGPPRFHPYFTDSVFLGVSPAAYIEGLRLARLCRTSSYVPLELAIVCLALFCLLVFVFHLIFNGQIYTCHFMCFLYRYNLSTCDCTYPHKMQMTTHDSDPKNFDHLIFLPNNFFVHRLEALVSLALQWVHSVCKPKAPVVHWVGMLKSSGSCNAYSVWRRWQHWQIHQGLNTVQKARISGHQSECTQSCNFCAC